MSYWILFGAIALVSYLVQNRLKSKFKEYSKVGTANGMSGKQVAEKMLADYGISGVRVISVSGKLTDHYNPQDRTVNLSEDVYGSNSIAAAAVAAHECGHAVQHYTQYSWLNLRSQLVPVVSLSSKWVTWILLGGILLMNSFPQLLLLGIFLFGLTTLFSFITLPVEIDASNRAIAWLGRSGISDAETTPMAKDALKWAANTYVVAALSSLATLIYYIMIYTSRD